MKVSDFVNRQTGPEQQGSEFQPRLVAHIGFGRDVERSDRILAPGVNRLITFAALVFAIATVGGLASHIREQQIAPQIAARVAEANYRQARAAALSSVIKEINKVGGVERLRTVRQIVQSRPPIPLYLDKLIRVAAPDIKYGSLSITTNGTTGVTPGTTTTPPTPTGTPGATDQNQGAKNFFVSIDGLAPSRQSLQSFIGRLRSVRGARNVLLTKAAFEKERRRINFTVNLSIDYSNLQRSGGASNGQGQ